MGAVSHTHGCRHRDRWTVRLRRGRLFFFGLFFGRIECVCCTRTRVPSCTRRAWVPELLRDCLLHYLR